MEGRDDVGFLNCDLGTTDVVESGEVEAVLEGVNCERQVDLDIGGTLWEDHFKGIVLSKNIGEILIEGIVEYEAPCFVLEQMVSGGHVVALAPVYLPLAEYWEARLDSEGNVVLITVCVGGRDIADVVPVIEAADVPGEVGLEALNGVLSPVWVPALVINASELALDSCGLVEQLVVLVDVDVAPVGDLDGLLDLGEDREWLVGFVVEHHL